MVTFNIRNTGNELLRILQTDFVSSQKCRLSIDLLIPDVLRGDKDGMCKSIFQICQFLDSKLLSSSVNIELSRVGHSDESLIVTIEVRGDCSKRLPSQRLLSAYQPEAIALLESLPNPTTFFRDGLQVRFTFSMLFFDDDSGAKLPEVSRKKVLLVEDDDMAALIFISFMEEWEYIVTRVADGVTAVEAAKQRVHDIILMDTLLPKMSGAEAIGRIRKTDKKTPIITLTTYQPDEDFMSRYAGANDFLIKPVDADDLKTKLKRYC